MTAESAAWLVLAVALCGASVTALIIGGKWIWRRSEVTEFAHAITATPADVARRHADDDACMELEVVIEELRELGMVR